MNFVKATKSLTQIPNPNIRTIRLDELFNRIKILFQPKFNEQNVSLTIQLQPADLSVDIDLELIEQVIINLIQNALEAMKGSDASSLAITGIKNDSGRIQISISDNGDGIGEEMLEKIFLPFFSTKNNNSGIGLSLSQQIMLLHHARLEVVSEKGKGATFIMIF